MPFKIGDTLIVNGEYDGLEFYNYEVTIYRLYGDSACVYCPILAANELGHADAWNYCSENIELYGLPTPSRDFGSWNVPVDWLEEHGQLVGTAITKEVSPHLEVIKKIQQMKSRREKLGYKY